MNVYFTSSRTKEGNTAQFQTIITAIEKIGHNVISEKQRIDGCDCVISEVTHPDSGIVGEIVYALSHHKPVLALLYKDAQNELTPMIAGNPSENLYLEHYEDDNISILLKGFFDQVASIKNRKGKLIVLEGGDGSGKATQSQLLVEELKNRGHRVKYMDFPRYYRSFHGKVVGRFLNGEFGTLDTVNPYLASLAYALDRASAKGEMDEWLEHGGTLVCNRYATSSMAHQAAKLPDTKKQEFIDWLDEMEYKVHKIPREDIVIYLFVPWKIGYELTLKKDARTYVNGKTDIAEKDLTHRKLTETMYLTLAKQRKNWIVIKCVDQKGALRSKDDIHKEIVETLLTRHII